MLPEHFASFLTRHHQPAHRDFERVVRQLSEAVEAGSSCLNLADSEKHTVAQWREILKPDAAGSTVGSPGSTSPLILTEDSQLYLQRYYLHEFGISTHVHKWLDHAPNRISAKTKKRFTELFPEENDQSRAADTALKNHFTIISGGPGTGKTTTVLKILMLLKEEGYYRDTDEVLLLAPTGKAADRLRQSILAGISSLGELPLDIPHEASTIHRTLGYIPNSIEFKHHAENPLAAKVVVIDESSMVDLPLMHRLFDAIPADARVILLGDKHQLSSVQVGTVLSDMMEAASSSKERLHDCSVTLQKSYRTQGPVNQICAEIKAGDTDAAWETLTQSSLDVLGATIHGEIPKNLSKALTHFVQTHWLPVLTDPALSPEQKLAGIDRFRILCPTHYGLYGIDTITSVVEKILEKHGIDTQQSWYPGRSVIVQQNDHSLGIYNGDTGIVLETQNPDQPQLVHFPAPASDETRTFSPARLPEVKTAWALTIHRTQGSEYDHILLIIPPSDDSPILSRELLYTGLSRAKKSATIWCSEESFKQTIHSTVQRASGLCAMFG